MPNIVNLHLSSIPQHLQLAILAPELQLQVLPSDSFNDEEVQKQAALLLDVLKFL